MALSTARWIPERQNGEDTPPVKDYWDASFMILNILLSLCASEQKLWGADSVSYTKQLLIKLPQYSILTKAEENIFTAYFF